MKQVPQTNARSSNAIWRFLVFGLVAAILSAGCLGSPKARPLDVPVDSGAEAQEAAGSTVQEGAPATAPAPNPEAAPSPRPAPPAPEPEPAPVPLPPAPAVGILELAFGAPSARGPVAVELVLAIDGAYSCTASTSFSVAPRAGTTSRHILWRTDGDRHDRIGDALFENNTLASVFSDQGVDVRPKMPQEPKATKDSYEFQFGSSGTKGVHEWTYLVAASDVEPGAGDPLSVGIECDRAFNVTGIRAGREVWLENEVSMGSNTTLGAGPTHAVDGGRFEATVAYYDTVWSAVATNSDAEMTLFMPPYAEESWGGSPFDEVAYWDLTGVAGEYELTWGSTMGSVSILLASLFPVGAVEYIDEALRPM